MEAIVAEDNSRLLAIRRELSQLANVVEDQPVAPDQAVAAAVERIMTLPENWRTLPYAEIKRFLAAVVDDLTIDLATLEVTLSVRVPYAATIPIDADLKDKEGRVNFASAWQSLPDTNTRKPNTSIQISLWKCQPHVKNCYSCFRIGAA